MRIFNDTLTSKNVVSAVFAYVEAQNENNSAHSSGKFSQPVVLSVIVTLLCAYRFCAETIAGLYMVGSIGLEHLLRDFRAVEQASLFCQTFLKTIMLVMDLLLCAERNVH